MRPLLVVVLVAATGCVPLRLSSECQTKISDCERNCSPAIPPNQNAYTGFTNDTQTPCERGCESLCNN